MGTRVSGSASLVFPVPRVGKPLTQEEWRAHKLAKWEKKCAKYRKPLRPREAYTFVNPITAAYDPSKHTHGRRRGTATLGYQH